jgi:hypothetical protein
MSASKLCDCCQAIDIVTLVETGSRLSIPHHRCWQELEAAVLFGCQLCRLLRFSIFQAYEAERDWDEGRVRQHHFEHDKEGLSCIYLAQARGGQAITYDRRPKHSDGSNCRFGDMGSSLEERFPEGLTIRPSLRVCSASEQMANVPGRLVTEYANLDLCKTWIDQCASSHVQCPRALNRALPTRLLDVGSSGHTSDFRLVETRGQKGQYVTLSHCWGKSRPPVMSTMTYEKNLECISIRYSATNIPGRCYRRPWS